ncbi:hypothetical protein [Sulfurimonas sp.]|uniref:hypothetical protein n=1 Tax=Sulfurimonas sp. TaxID=2022749 RepID=UPI003566A825
MKILCTETYEQELKNILKPMAELNFEDTKRFKTYLDTIIINIPTKVSKYKKSIYFYDENVKDIEYENFTIIFYNDEFNKNYVILSIKEK